MPGYRDQLFWSKVDIGEPDDCWPWKGCLVKGYGQFFDGEKPIGAHRYVVESKGVKLGGKFRALHRCNNKPCCNQNHLYVGTQKDNAADSIAAGTFVQHPAPRGEANWSAVLTEQIVREIRIRYPIESQAALAREFGVSRRTICKCVNRETWRHIA